MKYIDASALLRLLFGQPGPTLKLRAGDLVSSSRVIEVETYRAVDRERLLGNLDDAQTAQKRKELADLLVLVDLMPVDDRVIERARSSFPVNVRALDAIHVATAELLASETGGDPLEFWTHDERQANAALARGLAVRGRG